MDANTDRLLVLTATMGDAANVRDLGYKAERIPDNVLAFVMEHRESGLTLVSMLNEEGSKELRDACESQGVPNIIVSPSRISYALASTEALREVLDHARMQYVSAQIDSRDSKLKKVGVHSAWDIALAITSGEFVREPMPTGIEDLDEVIGGGVPRGGVTVIGAMSSAGKTSLVNQIGDNMARRGVPVLFATLEQSRYELAVMSISRIIGTEKYDHVNGIPTAIDYEGTLKNDKGTLKDGGARYATRSWIQSGPEKWTKGLASKIRQAAAEYESFASENLHYMETEEAPTVEEIRRAAETVREVHGGTSPAIIIDYLQIVRHSDAKKDERLAINDIMTSLRLMARDLETCVIVLSALSRSSLSQGVTLSSLRESGGIEYAADLCLGLQPTKLTEKVRSTKKLEANEVNNLIDDFRDQEVKSVDLRILKYRGAHVPKEGAHLHFDGRVCYFYGDSDIRRDMEDEVPFECRAIPFEDEDDSVIGTQL